MTTETNIQSPAKHVSLLHITCFFSALLFSAALPVFLFTVTQENNPGILFKTVFVLFLLVTSVTTGYLANRTKQEQWTEYKKELKQDGKTSNIETHIQDEKLKHTQSLQIYIFLPLVVFGMFTLTALF